MHYPLFFALDFIFEKGVSGLLWRIHLNFCCLSRSYLKNNLKSMRLIRKNILSLR